MIARYDCRHFLGFKPCMYRRECAGCPHFSAFGKRILIVKLAALGDVLRTTPLLRGLKAAEPGCHITWLTLPQVLPMLQGIREIDRLLAYDPETVLRLEVETFDELYCFDKEARASALTMKIQACTKVGFGMSEYGNVIPLGSRSEYAFELGISDELKFRRNRKTYPEIIYECAGLPYTAPQEYLFPDFSAELAQAHLDLERIGARGLKIGLNTGAGEVFATKKWTERGYAQLADRLVETMGATVLLLGGPAESERNARIERAARHPVVNTGNAHSIRAFSGIVGNCDLLVTGDTLAMHIAIGLKVPVVVILGATCHQEIDLYGRGAKVVSDFDCSPCYLSRCAKDVTCMDAIGVDRVFEAVQQVLQNRKSETGSAKPTIQA
jgi:ADP-heptose:LPS heptosyltransferase